MFYFELDILASAARVAKSFYRECRIAEKCVIKWLYGNNYFMCRNRVFKRWALVRNLKKIKQKQLRRKPIFAK